MVVYQHINIKLFYTMLLAKFWKHASDINFASQYLVVLPPLFWQKFYCQQHIPSIAFCCSTQLHIITMHKVQHSLQRYHIMFLQWYHIISYLYHTLSISCLMMMALHGPNGLKYDGPDALHKSFRLSSPHKYVCIHNMRILLKGSNLVIVFNR